MSDPESSQPRRHRAMGPLAAGVVAVLLLMAVGWPLLPPEPGPTAVSPPPEAAPEPPPRPPSAVVVPALLPAPRSLESPRPAPPVRSPGRPVAPPEAGAEGPATATAADSTELLHTCERIAAKLGSVSLADCSASRLRPSGARSTRGTPILVAEYPPLPVREPLGRVLLFGGIHGDELSSVSIVYNWLKTLDRFHSGLFHWRIAPLVNPDGLLRERSQRMNDRGVDLNRNFPSPNWRLEAPDYWIRRTSRNPRRYPGEAPLSEPESRWLHGQIELFQPQAIVAVHAPSHVVDYDGPPEPPQRLGPLRLHRMGTYPGSLGRFAGVHLGLPVVTIELPSAGIMPSPEDQRRMWVDLVAWLRRNVPKRTGERLARLEQPEPRTVGPAGMER